MTEKKTRKREKKIKDGKTFSVNLPSNQLVMLTYLADRKGKSVSAVMRDLVSGYIQANMQTGAESEDPTPE